MSRSEALDPIELRTRLRLFARVPLALGVALGLAQSSSFLAGRDAALLGATGAPNPASWGVAMIITVAAAVLPGAAVLWQGVQRGILLSVSGLALYLLVCAITVGQLGVTLPVIGPIGAWYLSQIMGIGWRPHSEQDVRHILPGLQRRVFISYRRSLDEVTARMFKHELTARGFDVFLDVDNLGPSPRFDQRLLEEIRDRYNFLLLLSPGALSRCHEANDWVRLEVECALAAQRRVIPVTRAGFDLGEGKDLPPSLSALPLHNAVVYSSTHHEAVIEQLVQFLCVPAKGAVPSRLRRPAPTGSGGNAAPG